MTFSDGGDGLSTIFRRRRGQNGKIHMGNNMDVMNGWARASEKSERERELLKNQKLYLRFLKRYVFNLKSVIYPWLSFSSCFSLYQFLLDFIFLSTFIYFYRLYIFGVLLRLHR